MSYSHCSKSVRSPIIANNHFPAQPLAVVTPHLRGISANNRTDLISSETVRVPELHYILVDNGVRILFHALTPNAITYTGPTYRPGTTKNNHSWSFRVIYLCPVEYNNFDLISECSQCAIPFLLSCCIMADSQSCCSRVININNNRMQRPDQRGDCRVLTVKVRYIILQL